MECCYFLSCAFFLVPVHTVLTSPPKESQWAGAQPRAQGAIAVTDLLSSLLLSYGAALTLGEAAVWPEATQPRMHTEPFFGLPACVINGCNVGVWPM